MPNAAQLLRQDHRKVEGLFKEFEQAKGSEAKKRIAEQAMTELEVHAKIEEEIFYPAVKSKVGVEELVDEAQQEHRTVKDLIRELKIMDGEGEEFEAKFFELIENVKRHVDEEETEMLPKAEESELDLSVFGGQMSERKDELQEEAGSNGPASKSARKSKSARRSSSSKRAR